MKKDVREMATMMYNDYDIDQDDQEEEDYGNEYENTEEEEDDVPIHYLDLWETAQQESPNPRFPLGRVWYPAQLCGKNSRFLTMNQVARNARLLAKTEMLHDYRKTCTAILNLPRFSKGFLEKQTREKEIQDKDAQARRQEADCKKKKNRPKRLNAFAVFSKEKSKELKEHNPTMPAKIIASKVSYMFKNLSDFENAKYDAKAQEIITAGRKTKNFSHKRKIVKVVTDETMDIRRAEQRKERQRQTILAAAYPSFENEMLPRVLRSNIGMHVVRAKMQVKDLFGKLSDKDLERYVVMSRELKEIVPIVTKVKDIHEEEDEEDEEHAQNMAAISMIELPDLQEVVEKEESEEEEETESEEESDDDLDLTMMLSASSRKKMNEKMNERKPAEKQKVENTQDQRVVAKQNGNDWHTQERKQREKSNGSTDKTRICGSVVNRTRCPHRTCRYAHNLSQLRTVKECGYGSECKKVRYGSSGYQNAPDCTKPCDYIHPDETNEEYWCRLVRME